VETARKCAGYYLRRTPAGLVPFWDFDAPEIGLWDSSAAAITASGLWDLSEQVDDPVEKSQYRSAALTILQTLCSDLFLARPHPAKIPRAKLQEPRAPSDFGSRFLEVGSSGPGGDTEGEREGWEGILRHGVYHYPKGLGVDESVIWGDHFFVEALVKALAGRSEAAW
jgi:unsaturated chondroitin disaccharide hydrolase